LCVSGFIAAGLPRRHVRRFAIARHQQTAVGVKCFSATVILFANIQPQDASSPGAALPEDGAADRVQARCVCLPLPPRSGVIVLAHQQSPAACLRRHLRPASLQALVITSTRLYTF